MISSGDAAKWTEARRFPLALGLNHNYGVELMVTIGEGSMVTPVTIHRASLGNGVFGSA